MSRSRTSATSRAPARQTVRGKPQPDSALADLDTQLMLQVRAGNRDAANQLIRRNFERISRYVTRLVGPHRPVEDITQDVFMRALRYADRYEPSAKVHTWLYRIATNTALNYLKQAKVRHETNETGERELDVPDRRSLTPERHMSLDELRGQVSHAVQALPLKQRIALTLFEYEGCSYEQIASVLDVSVEAVRSLLMRARTTLRGRLSSLL